MRGKVGEATGAQLVVLCNLTSRRHKILQTGPLTFENNEKHKSLFIDYDGVLSSKGFGNRWFTPDATRQVWMKLLWVVLSSRKVFFFSEQQSHSASFASSFCFSKEKFQQRHHPRDPWSERRGRRWADGDQSVSQMSHHIQTDPAAGQRARLQTHTGGVSHIHVHVYIHPRIHVNSLMLGSLCRSVSTWSPICSWTVKGGPGDVLCASTFSVHVSLHLL